MFEKYLDHPIKSDYLIAIIVNFVVIVLWSKCYISLPTKEFNISTATDLANISLTSTGFILTLLTILITFKGSTNVSKENFDPEKNTIFEAFINTGLYSKTINVLKGAIKSLIFIAILGYILKLSLRGDLYLWLFFYNITAIIIIVLSLLRSLFILNKIILFQEK